MNLLPAFLRRGGCDTNKMAASLAEQTGRLVKSRSILIDFRVALLIHSVRYAEIYKDAARLYQRFLMFRAVALTLRAPPATRAPLLKKEGSSAAKQHSPGLG